MPVYPGLGYVTDEWLEHIDVRCDDASFEIIDFELKLSSTSNFKAHRLSSYPKDGSPVHRKTRTKKTKNLSDARGILNSFNAERPCECRMVKYVHMCVGWIVEDGICENHHMHVNLGSVNRIKGQMCGYDAFVPCSDHCSMPWISC